MWPTSGQANPLGVVLVGVPTGYPLPTGTQWVWVSVGVGISWTEWLCLVQDLCVGQDLCAVFVFWARPWGSYPMLSTTVSQIGNNQGWKAISLTNSPSHHVPSCPPCLHCCCLLCWCWWCLCCLRNHCSWCFVFSKTGRCQHFWQIFYNERIKSPVEQASSNFYNGKRLQKGLKQRVKRRGTIFYLNSPQWHITRR